MEPTLKQKEIIESLGNVIVSASAGTGKTYTLVEKIKSDLKKNTSHKVIAAITFTIKAAKEINIRLTVNTSQQFIGTNNSFAIDEIIKPFMKDVYGSQFNKELNTDYSENFYSFQQGIEKIHTSAIIGSYSNNNVNFVFELALNILKESKACQLYLKAKYFKIYIDEYQDCDSNMNDFFMYICNTLKISVFIVGDHKQSIYIWRGAHPESFTNLLENTNFNTFILFENFRCCRQIQNYSSLLFAETRDFYKESKNNNNIIWIEANEEDCILEVIKYIDCSKSLAILRQSNANAKRIAELFTENKLDCVYIPKLPISSITTSDAWFYNAVASYKFTDNYSVFDFLEEAPESYIADKKSNQIKTLLAQIMECIEKDFNSFQSSSKLLSEYLGINLYQGNIQKLYETLIESSNKVSFNIDKCKRISTTIHSSKGLEFDQVIIFTEDYQLSREDDIYKHYVAVTRAKNKLIIINKPTNKPGATDFELKLSKLFYQPKRIILPVMIPNYH